MSAPAKVLSRRSAPSGEKAPGASAPVPVAAPAVRPAPRTAPVSMPRRTGGPARAPRAPSAPARPVSGQPAPTRAIGRRRPKRRAGFVVLFCVVVGSMVLGLVSLNALLAKASFRVDDLSTRIDALEVDHLELVSEQAELSAPGRIAEWARRNGMRLPDDIRLLHAPGASSTAPAGVADASGSDR